MPDTTIITPIWYPARMRCPPLAAHGATAFAMVKTTTTIVMIMFKNSKFTFAKVLNPLDPAISGIGAPEPLGSAEDVSDNMLSAKSCMTFTMKMSNPTIAA